MDVCLSLPSPFQAAQRRNEAAAAFLKRNQKPRNPTAARTPTDEANAATAVAPSNSIAETNAATGLFVV